MSTVKLQNVRISFPALFTPKAINAGDEPRYSAAFPIKPGSAEAKAILAAINSVATTKWGAKASAILQDLKSRGRVAFKEQELSKDGEAYAGFEGMHTLNASNKVRPVVLDRDRTPLTEADGRPYAGCYVVAIVEFWAQDNSFGKRINATLKGVQFYADGEAFSGGAPASPDDFDDLSDLALA